MTQKTRLVLASISPRRRMLLSNQGLDFEVIPSTVDESLIAADSPMAFAMEAARAKCVDVAQRTGSDRAVIGADTVVCFFKDAVMEADPNLWASPPVNARIFEEDGEIVLGKPEGPEEASRLLHLLSGRTHRVITGVALAHGGEVDVRADISEVVFRELSDEEIQQYIATGEPMDKAGAYGVQDLGGTFIARLDGDITNVIGLPMGLVMQMLRPIIE